MPGVGSGRSCDACRRRKKKCDERQPTCSRCERLRIECHGAGQKRFQFRYAVTANSSPGPFKRDTWSPNHELIRLSPPPTTDVLRTVSSLASILRIEEPGRSILSFGSFFREIPRRMEQSPVLAAAAKALTHSASTYYAKAPTTLAVEHYGRALETLRVDVACASEKTQFVNIICAIGILCLASNLMEFHRVDYEVHVRGLLSLLNRMPDTKLTTCFEKEGVAVAWSLVIGECIMDPSIEIDPGLGERHRRRHGSIPTGPAALTTESNTLRWENLMLLPRHLQDPVLYYPELAATYKEMLLEGPRLVSTAKQHSQAATTSAKREVSFRCILAETGCVELLSMSLVLNKTLQILDSSNSALTTQCTMLILEVIGAIYRLDRFKPLGTARLPNAMCLAWVTAPTPELKAIMRTILDDHILDFRGVTWEELAARYERRFRGIRARVNSSRQDLRLLE